MRQYLNLFTKVVDELGTNSNADILENLFSNETRELISENSKWPSANFMADIGSDRLDSQEVRGLISKNLSWPSANDVVSIESN